VTSPDVASRIVEIVSAVLDVDPSQVTRASSPDTISAWDSLRHLQLVLAIEEAFAIQFAVEDIESMGSVGAVVDAVKRRGATA
jgi:acyl carrier protein